MFLLQAFDSTHTLYKLVIHLNYVVFADCVINFFTAQ